ncbi:endonuclease domain-containing protein [Arthrobacter sp. efr-133-R2A-63]|uniref:endonuclease domain-containing protein n=1 Tax=Arthrobacter sp. efr-133-R2A-63 TaxID=3040278 RepID=UPI003306C359
MKARYGIDLDHYEVLLDAQHGHCAICPKGPAPGRRLAVDHDHKCCPGTVSCGKCLSGLLCPNCNRALGLFGENSMTLRSAAVYILLNKSAEF